jgi:hypothetical protein
LARYLSIAASSISTSGLGAEVWTTMSSKITVYIRNSGTRKYALS